MSEENTTIEETEEQAPEPDETTDTTGTEQPDQADTFPREYVEQLRKEAADNRVKAKRTDELAGRLHTHLVAATGRLADPTDLPFDPDHLEDPDALEAAITDLLETKPHLASRVPRGNIGQGSTGDSRDEASLLGLLNRATG